MTQVTDEPANQRPGTTHPRLARERALKVLFAADVRRVDARKLLDEVETHEPDLELLDELEPDQAQVEGDEDLQLELTRRRRLPLDDYTRLLVDGVASRQRQIDDLLGEVADNWQVHRMPSVDRNLLRLGIYELAEQDTPDAVVIDEAVSLAVAFAGDKAQSFVNGVLEAVRKKKVAGEVDLTPPPPPEPEPADPASDASSAVEESDGDDRRDAAPAAAPVGVDADVAVDEEHVAEPEVTTEDVDEVDVAAQEAYDLALDLLEAEGPLDEHQFDDRPEPDESDEFDLDAPAVDPGVGGGADADPDELADQDQAAFDLGDLDGAGFDADIEFVGLDEDPVGDDDLDAAATDRPGNDDEPVDEPVAGDAGDDDKPVDAEDESVDEGDAGHDELRDAGDALW